MRLRHRSLLVLVSAVSFALGCSSGSDSTDDSPAAASSAGGGGGSSGASGSSQAGGSGGASGTGGASGKGGASGGGGSAGASGGGSGSGGKGGGGSGGAAASGGSGGGSGAAGASGGAAGAPAGACSNDSDCMPLPTMPPGCAEAKCEGATKKCVYHAKDADKDTYPTGKCKALDGTTPVVLGEDCDDTNPDVHPKGWDGPAGDGNPDHCNDGIDQDCSGTDDDGKLKDGTTCTCSPGDTQTCSQDSSGKPITFPKLVNGKPVGVCALGNQTCLPGGKWGPCTDAIPPGPYEMCDLNGKIDEDCDGLIDDADPDVVGKKTWVCDADNDNYINHAAAKKETACKPAPEGCPSGQWLEEKLAPTEDDCDDTSGLVHPGAVEQCNGKDDNCNGQIDENVTYADYWWDNDHDGTPGATSQKNACAAPACPPGGNCADGQWLQYNLGQTPPAIDNCDSAADLKPGNAEVCDGKDNDCDGTVDNNTPPGPACEVGVGACHSTGNQVCSGGAYQGCSAVAGGGAAEACDDGIDNDCDGQIDESGRIWYQDLDNDGACNYGATVDQCASPGAGWRTDCPKGSDCFDGNGAVQTNGQYCETGGCPGSWSCSGSGASCQAPPLCQEGTSYPGSGSVCTYDAGAGDVGWGATSPAGVVGTAAVGDPYFQGIYKFQWKVSFYMRANPSGCCDTSSGTTMVKVKCVYGSGYVDIAATGIPKADDFGAYYELTCDAPSVEVVKVNNGNYCCCGCGRYANHFNFHYERTACTY